LIASPTFTRLREAAGDAREATVSDFEDKLSAFADELRHVIDDPRWQRVDGSRWLRFREIDGTRIGVIRATMSPQRSNYALNCGEMERLRNGKSAGKADLIVVVAIKTNSDGRREYCCQMEADALYQKTLRNKTPIDGQFGPFWSLSQYEIEGVDHRCREMIV
jgi:hypothetical protein